MPSAVAKPANRLSFDWDPLRIAVFMLTVITVSRIHQQYGFIAKLRPALLLTFLAALYAYLNPRYLATGSIFRTWPGKVVLALGILACISTPFAISSGNSGKFILDVYSKNLVFCFLVIAATRSVRDLYAWMWGFTIGALLLTYLALFVFQLQNYGTDFGYARLAGLHGWDANDVACVLMVGLACTLLVMQVSGPLGRMLGLATLVGIGATVARSGSRGGMLGLVAVGVALLFLVQGVSMFKRLGVIVLAAAGLVLWAPPGYWDQMRTMLEPKNDYNWNSREGRKAIAKRGIGYMVSRPLLGLGINNFTKAECTISDKAKTNAMNTALRCTPPHNSFIQAGAELGFPGLLLWSSLMLVGIPALLVLRARLPRHWQRGDPEQRFLHAATSYLAVALVGFAVTAFFLTFAWLEIYYMLAAFYAGLLVCVEAKRREASSDSGTMPTPTSRPPEFRTWRPAHAHAYRRA